MPVLLPLNQLFNFSQLFQSQVVLPRQDPHQILAQGNIGFAMSDVGITHPVKVEAQSCAIIDCITASIPNNTPLLIDLQVPHSGVLVHYSIAKVKKNRVEAPM